MKSFVITFCLFAMSAFAQTTSIDASVLATMCPGASLYDSSKQADMDSLPVPFNRLVYAPKFTCVIPVTCTLCRVTLGFVENRSDPATIGPGKRLFTVSFPGGTSDVIDLFVVAGVRTPYQRVWMVPVYDGKLRITLSASALNALLSQVSTSEYLTIGIVGPPGPQGNAGYVEVRVLPGILQCAEPIFCQTDPNTNLVLIHQ